MFASDIELFAYFLLGKIALLHGEPQCHVSRMSWVDDNGTEVVDVVDSDASTCFILAGNEKKWLQISLPVKQMKPQSYVWLIGNLKCSPLNGLSVSIIGDCENGSCNNSVCIASDYITSDGMVGCKYRCQSVGICNDIIVDIAGISGIDQPRSICEIVY